MKPIISSVFNFLFVKFKDIIKCLISLTHLAWFSKGEYFLNLHEKKI